VTEKKENKFFKKDPYTKNPCEFYLISMGRSNSKTPLTGRPDMVDKKQKAKIRMVLEPTPPAHRVSLVSHLFQCAHFRMPWNAIQSKVFIEN